MDDPAAIPNIKNSGIAEILVNYLSLTKPGMLFLHLVWLTIVCIILSFTYIYKLKLWYNKVLTKLVPIIGKYFDLLINLKVIFFPKVNEKFK